VERVFEFDKNKSQINKEKHGISFDEAKILWQDKNALVVGAKTIGDENRFALIAKLNGKCYVAIFTLRGMNYRIISVRRCRKKEEQNYEKRAKSSFNNKRV